MSGAKKKKSVIIQTFSLLAPGDKVFCCTAQGNTLTRGQQQIFFCLSSILMKCSEKHHEMMLRGLYTILAKLTTSRYFCVRQKSSFKTGSDGACPTLFHYCYCVSEVVSHLRKSRSEKS